MMNMFGTVVKQPAAFGKRFAIFTALMVLAACATHIQPKDETQTPPSVPFGTFTPVLFKPLGNQTPKEFSPDAAARVQSGLQSCLSRIFNPVLPYSDDAAKANPNALVIDPVILDGKKVTVADRILFGWMAGSSAVLMQLTYTSVKDGAVLAKPIFYAKAAAISGASTYGAMDNVMLDRISEKACEYTTAYKASIH